MEAEAKLPMSTGLRVVLLAERAPYLLTLFVAAFTWLVSYTVDRYEGAPLLAYSTTVDGRGAADSVGRSFTTSVRNVSPSGLTSCARIEFTAHAPDDYREIPLTPGQVGRIAGPAVDHTFKSFEKQVRFQMDFHPGSAIELPMRSSAPATMTLSQSPCTSEDGKPSNSPLPLLIESSPKTWVIHNSLALLWIGLIAWAIGLCLIYLTLGRGAAGSRNAARRLPDKCAGRTGSAEATLQSTQSGGICP